MAGSVARGATEAEDERLAEQLRSSRKDAAEHDVVSRFVVEALRPFSRSVAARPPEVVRFTNIQHLATSVDAELSPPAADALDLAAALHPTPAVGGWPRDAADRIIDDLESLERGWYAGAVGWTDALCLDHSGPISRPRVLSGPCIDWDVCGLCAFNCLYHRIHAGYRARQSRVGWELNVGERWSCGTCTR